MALTLDSVNVASVAGYSGLKARATNASAPLSDEPKVDKTSKAGENTPASKVTLSRSQLEFYRSNTEQRNAEVESNASAPVESSLNSRNAVLSGQESNFEAQQARQELTRKEARLRQAESQTRNISQDLSTIESSEFSDAELRLIKSEIRQAERLERNLQLQIKQQEKEVARFEKHFESTGNAVISESVSADRESVSKPIVVKGSGVVEDDVLAVNSLLSAEPPSETSIAKARVTFNEVKSVDPVVPDEKSRESETALDKDKETAADRFRDVNRINEKVYTDYFSRKSRAEFIENIDTYFNPDKK